MQVHVIQTGRNLGNETVMRDMKWSSNFRRRKPFDFPVYAFIVEHPEGTFAIDTGLSTEVRIPFLQHRLLSVPSPLIEPHEEIDSQLEPIGLEPEDVERVVLTHLDWDHAGGIRHFPGAEILVHRPELEYAAKLFGIRYLPKLWPSWFDPPTYDLDPVPYGPFPESKALTESEDVWLVPIPGHTVGQVGVVVELEEEVLFFSADHVLRQDWFIEDVAAGRPEGLAFFPELARPTTRRILEFTRRQPTVLLPSHDTETPTRLEELESLEVGALAR